MLFRNNSQRPAQDSADPSLSFVAVDCMVTDVSVDELVVSLDGGGGGADGNSMTPAHTGRLNVSMRIAAPQICRKFRMGGLL